MRARLDDYWENLQSSLWLLPGLMALVAALLAFGMLQVDRVVPLDLRLQAPFLFGGTAEAARSLLSVIAGSLATIVALAFSVLIVALNQAAAQFTPRVLRTFMRDRGYQIVLGSYIGTFLYALLVLRQVRGATESAASFVPALSITLAIALTLYCLGLLVYFFHHSAQTLQVAHVLEEVHQETLAAMERLYPHGVGEPAAEREDVLGAPPRGERVDVRSETAGFLRAIDVGQLLSTADRSIGLVRIVPRIGAYVPRGATLARVWSTDGLPAGFADTVRGAFVLGTEATMTQDVLFGIRQIADIAIRALSPAVNDPTTAEQALSHLGDLVGELGVRSFPPRLRAADGAPTLFWLARPGFGDVVEEAFGQIRREAADDVHVTDYLLDVLALLAERLAGSGRGQAVGEQAREVLAQIDRSSFSDADRQRLRTSAEKVLELCDEAAGEAAFRSLG